MNDVCFLCIVSFWKAQTTCNVKDFNLWRRVLVTEAQKNTTGSLKELVLLHMWYGVEDLISWCGNATYSSYAAAGNDDGNNKKNWILMEMQEKSPDVSTTCCGFFFMIQVFIFHRAAAVSSEPQHRSVFFFLNECSHKYSWDESWTCIIVRCWMIVRLSMRHWSTNHWKSKRCWWIFRSSIGFVQSALAEVDLELQCREQ